MSLLRLSSTLLLNLTKSNAVSAVTTNRAIHRWVAPTLRELRKRRLQVGPEPLQPRSSFLDWNYNAEIYAFGKRLNEEFDRKLLQQAFTFKSFLVQEEMKQKEIGIAEPNINMEDNSKLIEKGEQLMSDYVEAFLLANLPKLPDAGIKAIKAYLLSENVLAKISSLIGTKDIILTSEFPVENVKLASTFKAIVGALAESSGEDRAFIFIRDFVCTQLNQKDISEYWTIEKPMNLLEDLCRDKNMGAPEPRLIGDMAKTDILATFHVGIYCNKRLLSSGFGENIDTAIETAAINSLKEIFGTQESMKPINYQITLDEISKSLKRRADKL